MPGDNLASMGDESAAMHAVEIKQMATGSSINFIGSISRTLLTFVYTIFLAAFLEPEVFGYFFLGLTMVSLLSTASLMGLDTGVVRYTALYDGEGDRGRVRGAIAGAVAVAVPASLVAAVLLAASASAIADGIFQKPGLAPVLKLFAPAVPLFVIARLLNSATQGLRQMRYQVYSRDFSEQLIRFLLSAIALIAGLGLSGVIGANVVALFVAMLLALYFLHRVEPAFSVHRKRIFEQGRLLGYSAPLAASTLITFFLLWNDTFFLAKYHSADDVGIYSLAVRLAIAGSVIIVSFNMIFAPLASDLFNRNERARLENLLRFTNKWILCFSLPVFAVLILLPEQVLGVIGASYTAASTALVILALGQLVNAASGPVALLLMMSGRPAVVMISNLAVLLVDIALCFLLIPGYGLVGAAIASAVTIALFNLVSLAGVMILLKLRPFSLGYLKSWVAGVFAVLLAYVVLNALPSPWSIIASVGTLLGVFAAAVLLTAIEDSDAIIFRAMRAKIFRGA